MTDTLDREAPLRERIARAWASIDGKLAQYEACKEAPTFEEEIALGGYYAGYLAEADILIGRAGIADALDAKDAVIERLVGALEECSDDLEDAVKGQYPPDERYDPPMDRRYKRDMEPVERARAAIRAAKGEDHASD